MKPILAIFALSIAIVIYAQEDKEIILPHQPMITGQLNDYISFMAKKNKPEKSRFYYMNKALKLFIGNGDSYEENGVVKNGVLIHVKSKVGKELRGVPVKTFFQSLIKGGRNYSDIRIEAIELVNIKVSDLQKINNDLWVCNCQTEQAFEGVRDGRLLFRDINAKRIKCYLTKEDLEDGLEYIIKLGDIYAIETK